MQLGMIGLGRMGANMVRRLMQRGHECVVHDRNPDAVATLARVGAVGASSIEDFAAKLSGPKTAWLMLPAGEPTETVVLGLSAILPGGSTRFRSRQDHTFAEKMLSAMRQSFGGHVEAGAQG